jgi:hypothetical protein
MMRRAAFLGLLLLAAGFAAAAPPRRRHARKARNAPVLSVAPGTRLSLKAAAPKAAPAADSAPSSPATAPAFTVKLLLKGGGAKTWVSESCNPVVPVVNGEMRPGRQCFTDFYAKVALANGRGEPVEFQWELNDPQHPLKAGDSVRFMMTLGSDCEKSTGPGLFAFGDCKVREQIMSPPVVIKE